MVRFHVLSGFLVAAAAFTPDSVSFEYLQGGPLANDESNSVFEDALTEVGVVTISDIPGYSALRRRVLSEANRCIQASPKSMRILFEDGTVRTSLAGVSDALGTHKIIVDEAAESTGQETVAACEAFQASSGEFRDLVTRVSSAFGARLGELVSKRGGFSPLLRAVGNAEVYDQVSDIFRHGKHLEHFHSYHAPARSPDVHPTTIDFHRDQGLCIAFSAALLVQQGGTGAHSDDALPADRSAGEFQIELRSGERVAAEFPSDHLVFMLGDGVDQYVNRDGYAGEGLALRAVPHAMTMPDHASSEYRSWYGRMFLPPEDAVDETHGLTYGSIRRIMNSDLVSEEDGGAAWEFSLGCSSGQRARLLMDDPGCADNQYYCWHRCMSYTDGAEPDDCAAQGMEVRCTDPDGNLREGDEHGTDMSWAPRCWDAPDTTEMDEASDGGSGMDMDDDGDTGDASLAEGVRGFGKRALTVGVILLAALAGGCI